MALEAAKQNSVDIASLAGKGSGEGGRVNYWDVHRLAHPPKFHSRHLIENQRHSLSEESLDAVFERTWGKQRIVALTQLASRSSPPWLRRRREIRSQRRKWHQRAVGGEQAR